MANETLTVPSGATVEIRIGSFQAGMALKNAIEYELSKSGMAILPKGMTKETEIDLEKFIPILLQVDSSPSVQKALWDCAVQSTYNGEKITPKIFDEEDARQDYYAIIIAVGKKNLMPFMKGLVSGLNGLGGLMKLIGQKSSS